MSRAEAPTSRARSACAAWPVSGRLNSAARRRNARPLHARDCETAATMARALLNSSLPAPGEVGAATCSTAGSASASPSSPCCAGSTLSSPTSPPAVLSQSTADTRPDVVTSVPISQAAARSTAASATIAAVRAVATTGFSCGCPCPCARASASACTRGGDRGPVDLGALRRAFALSARLVVAGCGAALAAMTAARRLDRTGSSSGSTNSCASRASARNEQPRTQGRPRVRAAHGRTSISMPSSFLGGAPAAFALALRLARPPVDGEGLSGLSPWLPGMDGEAPTSTHDGAFAPKALPEPAAGAAARGEAPGDPSVPRCTPVEP